jgi:acyl dehydratase
VLRLDQPSGFRDHVGAVLGPTDWRLVTQPQIDAFAAATGDDHWIHVDTERAARERPDGRTIAHGLYLLALIPRWQRDLFTIARRGVGLNYGYDKVRFILPVPVDARIRLGQTVRDAQPHALGTRVWIDSTIEVDRPGQVALVAQGVLVLGD